MSSPYISWGLAILFGTPNLNEAYFIRDEGFSIVETQTLDVEFTIHNGGQIQLAFLINIEYTDAAIVIGGKQSCAVIVEFDIHDR